MSVRPVYGPPVCYAAGLASQRSRSFASVHQTDEILEHAQK